MRWHLTACGVMLAGQAGWHQDRQACREVISDGEGLVQQWWVTQLTRLGIPGRWRRPRPVAWAGIRSPGWPGVAVPRALAVRMVRWPVGCGGPGRGQQPRPAGAGRGGTRQAGGRHHGPSGPSRTPVVPDGQWRAVPVPVIAPGPAALRGSSSPLAALGLAGPVPEVLPSRARVRVPVSWRGYRVTACPAGGRSPYQCEARSPRQNAAWPWRLRPATPAGPHGQKDHHRLRLDPHPHRRRRALAGSCEKATGVHGGKKEGRKQ